MNTRTRQALRTYAPFSAVALLAELTQLFGVSQVSHRWAQATAAVLVALLLVLGASAVRVRRMEPLAGVVLPFGFLLVVGLWRHATSGSTSVAPLGMVGLSVLWLGLFGTRRLVWAGVVAVALVLGAPMLVLGSPDYPVDDWPRAVLYTAFAAVLGPTTHRLVAGLAGEQQVLRLTADHLPNTIVGLVGRDLRWRSLHGRWLADHGVDPDAVIGSRVGERMAVDDPDGLVRFLEDSFAHGGQQVVRTPGGTWFEMDAEPVAGAAGEPLLLVVSRDVTARREADAERADMVAALRASEESFRTAFEQAPTGIALTTVDQGPDAEYLRVNPAFAELVGRSQSDLEGRRVDELTHPEEIGRRPAAAGDYQTRLLRPTGSAVWVSVRAAEVPDRQGRPAYVINHVADITARRASEMALLDALEQQRAAAETLRELERVRDDTMSTISHELRTPLTSMVGYLELLNDGAAGPLAAEQEQMLAVVRRNADRLRALVDDLLELSRLDHQTATATLDEPVDLGDLARGVIESVRPMAGRKSQELLAWLPDVPLVVSGSAEQLDRALTNLVANAVKYTPEGGRVEVRAERAGDDVRIAVRDTGIGIPAAEQARLFDRFFRSSTALRRGIEGTGLGLAIVRSIVERHDGTVDVDSAAGEGSTFTLTVPARDRTTTSVRRSGG